MASTLINTPSTRIVFQTPPTQQRPTESLWNLSFPFLGAGHACKRVRHPPAHLARHLTGALSTFPLHKISQILPTMNSPSNLQKMATDDSDLSTTVTAISAAIGGQIGTVGRARSLQADRKREKRQQEARAAKRTSGRQNTAVAKQELC